MTDGRSKSRTAENIDKTLVFNALDEEWRSPSDVRRRFGLRATAAAVASALENLSASGLIECDVQEIAVSSRRNSTIAVKRYRRKAK